MTFITAAGHRLDTKWIGARDGAGPVLVFLHEGLGSIALWRDFPDRIAEMTGCAALVYSRHGYGRSDPLGKAARRATCTTRRWKCCRRCSTPAASPIPS